MPPPPPAPLPLRPVAGSTGNATHNTRAIVAMLLAVGLLSVMDAGMKALSGGYPPLQVAALRGGASLPLLLAWALWTVGPRPLLRARWSLHLLRGAIGIGMLSAFVYALQTLSLANAYAIFFVAPLLITALSVPLLGEHVGPRRWGAIAAGLVGVFVALRPTGEGIASLAGLAVLCAALGYAVSAITVRILSRTDSTQAMVVWLMAFVALGAGALAWPAWVPIARGDLWIVAGIGLAGALGQVAVTEAFRQGEVSLVAPFEYTALAWGVGLDVALWGIVPDVATWLGAAIVIASGLYLLRRERVRAEEAASEAAAADAVGGSGAARPQ